MSVKKISLNELRRRISQMVREEVQRALNEDVSPHLKRVRDKDEMVAWVMRQYFNPSKDTKKPWYSPDVTPDNVLEYVSDPDNGFPLTPKELADLWKLKKSLGSSLELANKELDAVSDDEADAEDEDEVEKTTYQTGERTLKDIGQELGGLTPTMINKLAASASEKIKNLTQGSAPWDLDDDEWDEILRKIKNARKEVAYSFAEDLKTFDGDVDAFLENLHKQHILTPSDLKLVSDREVEGLKLLSRKPVEQIVRILLADIEQDDNLFKSYQSAVSKKVFPPRKRGRPKKNID